MSLFSALLFVIVGVGLILVGFEGGKQENEISKLQREVECLKHPTSGASSTAVKRVNGHWVVTRPPYRTVC
jgi:hypothetical protein